MMKIQGSVLCVNEVTDNGHNGEEKKAHHCSCWELDSNCPYGLLDCTKSEDVLPQDVISQWFQKCIKK
jgi:hypothetical protein